MRFRTTWLPLLAALALPGALRAQEDDCPCRTRPGMIGVTLDTETTESGVRIIEVRRGSPADRAGVRGGDVVVRLNGQNAAGMHELPMRLQSGDTVHLRIRREGDEREVVVVAEPRPATQFSFINPSPGEQQVIITRSLDSLNLPLQALTFRLDSLHSQLLELNGARLQVNVDSMVRVFTDSAGVWRERMPAMQFRMREGMPEDVLVQGMAIDGERPFFMELGRRAAAGAELAEMNEGLSAYFGGQRDGALVIDVSEDTPAARAGLRPGDVIVRAGGDEVSDPEDVRRALNGAEAGRVSLEVIRQGRRQELSLEWTGGDRWFRSELRRTAPRN